MRFKLIAGIFSLMIIALVIVGPMIVADKLEQVETSQDGIMSISEILESSYIVSSNETIPHNETTITYTPYLEFNEQTKTPSTAGGGYYDAGIHEYTGSAYREFDEVEYNILGLWEYFQDDTGTSSGQTYIFFEMNCSASQLITDNVDDLRLAFDIQDDYRFDGIWFRRMDADYTNAGRYEITIPAGWDSTIVSGLNYFNMTISQADLNAGATYQGSRDIHTIQVVLRCPSTITAESPMYSTIQLNPEYFEQEIIEWDNETVWTNETVHEYEEVNHYVPYIQEYSPFNVHKVMMGIGGVLIILIGWIASPWNEFLDGILPINRWKKSDQNRKRKKKRKTKKR